MPGIMRSREQGVLLGETNWVYDYAAFNLVRERE